MGATLVRVCPGLLYLALNAVCAHSSHAASSAGYRGQRYPGVGRCEPGVVKAEPLRGALRCAPVIIGQVLPRHRLSLRGGSDSTGGDDEESSQPLPPPSMDGDEEGTIQLATGSRDGDDEHANEVVERPVRPGLDTFEVETMDDQASRTFDVSKLAEQHSQARFYEVAKDATSLVADGGVCIETVREGSGTRVPRDGDFVYIHYRAFVLRDGRQFDNSRSSDQRNGMPFGFVMGRGQVIQGWETALHAMTVGQVAKVYVRNAYSYAPDGTRLKGVYTRLSVYADACIRIFEIKVH